jgi:glycosyltransferase involved in cell wall biosynthesis
MACENNQNYESERVSDTPLISVIIPNYNNEVYLPSCLESVLSQDYPNFEVIVVDDASTDNSQDVLRGYCDNDSRVSAVLKQVNCGVGSAREEGIRRASGDYISTLDSDDIYLSASKLSDEYRVLKKFEKVSLRPIIAYSNIELISEVGRSIGVKNTNYAEGDILAGILSRSIMIPRDFLLSRALFHLVGGFNQKIPLYEDWDLKIRLAKQADFVFSGNCGIGYRQHSSGLSTTHYARHVYWLLYVGIRNFSCSLIRPYSRAAVPLSKKLLAMGYKGIIRKIKGA